MRNGLDPLCLRVDPSCVIVFKASSLLAIHVVLLFVCWFFSCWFVFLKEYISFPKTFFPSRVLIIHNGPIKTFADARFDQS